MATYLDRTRHRAPASRARVPISAVLVCVWIIPAALVTFETYTFARMEGRPFALGPMIVRESATWATYAVLTPVVLWLAGRFPLRASRLGRHLALHCFAAILMATIAAGVATAASRLVGAPSPQIRATAIGQLFLEWFLSSISVALLSYFAVVGVAHAIAYFGEAQRRREDALRLEAQLADARLAALQGRLHPHFLYNTLNAITVLVRDGDVARSTRMLELLGAMLRRVLDGSLPQVVPLRTELALLRQYLEIEEVRFSDRLTVIIDAPDAVLDAGVPALVMQPLAENAVRHAVARTSRAIIVRIAASVRTGADGDVLELLVEDNGPGLAAGWEARRAERTGLAATAMRLATLYGARASLDVAPRSGGGRQEQQGTDAGDAGGAVSRVRLPFTRVAALAPPPDSARGGPGAPPQDVVGIRAGRA